MLFQTYNRNILCGQARCGRISGAWKKAPRGNAGQKDQTLNRRDESKPARPGRASPNQPEALATFNAQLFADGNASRAMQILESAGVEMNELVSLLYDAHLVLKWRQRLEEKHLSFADALGLKDSRSVDQLVTKLRGLAEEMENVEEALSRSGLTVYWYTEPWKGGYYKMLSSIKAPMSKILRAEASWIESAGQSVKQQPTTSVAEIVEDQVAAFVLKRAGRPHISQVATLINWLYRQPGCGGFQTTEEALSRRRRRMNFSRKANN